MGDVGTVSVPLYWCSKCFSPLQLDPSLTEHLDLEAYRQVAGTHPLCILSFRLSHTAQIR